MSDLDLAQILDENDVNLDEVEIQERSSDPVPAGEYLVSAIEGDVVRKDDGKVGLKLTWEIQSGPHEGRRLWEYLNIVHSNADAQRIAIERLTQIWRDSMGGTGRPGVDDLLMRPIMAKVTIQKRKDTGEYQNRISKYYSAETAPPAAKAAPAAAPKAAPKAAPAAQPPKASAGAGNRPWAGKR